MFLTHGGMNETDAINLLHASLTTTQSNLNDFFIVISGILVFAMQAGFSLMETGLVRSKNATNILMKSTLDAFIGATAYWLIGYAFAYGDGNDFIGWTGFALQGTPTSRWSFWFYQCIFANTASTIASGATAERINLPAFLCYSFLLTGLMYPLASRWAWHPTGWLKLRGFVDFGGSGVVHMLGGVCALVATLIVGPRIGRFGPKTDTCKKGDTTHYRGHSTTLTGIGAFLLMLGIMGYNMSSQLSITQPGDGLVAARSAVNTLLAGSAGAIVATVMGRATPTGGHRWSYLTMLNGSIAGMVASCAGCNAMPFWAAYLTGGVAGFAFFALRALMNRFHVDDPLDAFAVHFGGGFSGMALTPLLSETGVLLVGDHQSAMVLAWQFAGIFVLIAWGVGFCLIMFGALKIFGILRVDARIEVNGMDAVQHNEPAYPAESWEEQQYWDHQVYRLIHLLNAAASTTLCAPEPITAIDLECLQIPRVQQLCTGREQALTGNSLALPPQMNFAHLVLTDHFQKCVLSLDRLQGPLFKWNQKK